MHITHTNARTHTHTLSLSLSLSLAQTHTHTHTTREQNLKVMTRQRVNAMVGGECGIERARLISCAEERLDAEFVGKLRFGRTPDRGRFLETLALDNRVSIQVGMLTCYGASL